MKKFLFVLLLCGAVFSAEQVHLEKSEKLPLPPELQKDILPWFVVKAKDGKQSFSRNNLKQLVKPGTERVALVFFATWCVPCKQGVVKLRENFDELVKNNVLVVLVNAGESDLELINKWIKEFGDERWTLILDRFQNIVQKSGLLPESQKNIVFPKTIITDSKLKPLMLIGAEGDDYPSVLWE